MIQRIQTLFLLATAILLIVILFVPIWGAEEAAGTARAELDAFNLVYTFGNTPAKNVNTVYIGILAFVGAIVATFSISRFKNRKLQMTLGWLNILVISGLIGTFFLAIKKGQEIIGDHSGSYHIGFFLPMVAIVTTYMANYYIKKDEKLVRSMDRLR